MKRRKIEVGDICEWERKAFEKCLEGGQRKRGEQTFYALGGGKG